MLILQIQKYDERRKNKIIELNANGIRLKKRKLRVKLQRDEKQDHFRRAEENKLLLRS